MCRCEGKNVHEIANGAGLGVFESKQGNGALRKAGERADGCREGVVGVKKGVGGGEHRLLYATVCVGGEERVRRGWGCGVCLGAPATSMKSPTGLDLASS